MMTITVQSMSNSLDVANGDGGSGFPQHRIPNPSGSRLGESGAESVYRDAMRAPAPHTAAPQWPAAHSEAIS